MVPVGRYHHTVGQYRTCHMAIPPYAMSVPGMAYGARRGIGTCSPSTRPSERIRSSCSSIR
eukprot:3875346-Rhodomonas_salina.1